MRNTKASRSGICASKVTSMVMISPLTKVRTSRPNSEDGKSRRMAYANEYE